MMLAISLPGIFRTVEGMFREIDWLCKAVLVLKMYSAMTCIHWMFVEGLLLHSSITVSVFQQEPPFKLYYAIGWGIPLVCVGSWLLLMALYLDRPCWKGYGHSPFVWFITGPMIVALVVNAVFLVNIIRILVTKLRTSVSIETKQVKKAMKATALLFPLLGITHLLFCINPRDEANLEHIYMLVNAVLQSSQGLFVAVLYCFLNSEVQTVLATAYARSTLKRSPRRSYRSSRCSRMLGSTTSTSLSPDLPNGSGFTPPGRMRFALLQKTSLPLKNRSEDQKEQRDEEKVETAFLK
ncbi:PDF receptor, partial [Stegodyphus mimosarum]